MPEATSLMEAPTTAGTYAQYAVVSESVLGIKPKSLSISVAETKPGSLGCLEQHPIPQPRHAGSRCHADGCPHWAWVPDAGGRWPSFSKRKYDCAGAWGKNLGLIECCFNLICLDWFSSDHERFDHWDCFQRCHVYYWLAQCMLGTLWISWILKLLGQHMQLASVTRWWDWSHGHSVGKGRVANQSCFLLQCFNSSYTNGT